MTSSGQSVPTNGAATTNDVTTCPLCTETAAELCDIYRHLMVTHRKSELSRLVLSFVDTREGPNTRCDESDPSSEAISTDSLV